MFTFYTLKPSLLIDVATYSYLISPHLTFPSLISSSEVTALILRQLHNKRRFVFDRTFLSPLFSLP